MSDNQNVPAERKQKFISTIMNQEFVPAIVDEQVNMTQYNKLPLSMLPSLGVAFEPITAAFQFVLSGGEATSGLYRVTVQNGGHLAKLKDGSAYIGGVMDKGNQVAGQARLNPLVVDPTYLCMAIALANIDRKLSAIQETQQELLDFLIQKERSELKGDLNFLSDTMNNYKHNWNNEKFKTNNHIKVLDIRQAAEQKIDFFREQITSRIKKKSFIHVDKDVRKQMEKIQAEFKDYQLALYIYGFSSFLEVMLLENFAAPYLESVIKKIDDHAQNYRMLFTNCCDQIESYAKSSVQSKLIKGLANANLIAGVVAEKVPVLSKTQFDETLIAAGDKIDKFADNRIDEAMSALIEKQSHCAQPFVDNIAAVNRIYNQPLQLLFDKENLYTAA
jgi:hypothetical protein